MKLAPVSVDLLIKLALLAAGVGLAVYGYKRFTDAFGIVGKTALDLAASAAEVADSVIVGVGSAWNNNVSAPFNAGYNYGTTGATRQPTEKEILYGDAGYSGNDPDSGLPVGTGEWYTNQDALRYENEQRAAGTLPAYTSTNGAAFGVFPQMGIGAALRNVLLTIQDRGRVVGGL